MQQYSGIIQTEMLIPSKTCLHVHIVEVSDVYFQSIFCTNYRAIVAVAMLITCIWQGTSSNIEYP